MFISISSKELTIEEKKLRELDTELSKTLDKISLAKAEQLSVMNDLNNGMEEYQIVLGTSARWKDAE